MADPRLEDTPINVNDQIQDRTIRHMVYIERLKASEIKRIRKILDSEILPDLEDRISRRLLKIEERGSDLGPATTKRLQELQKELTKLSSRLAVRLRTAVGETITGLSRSELAWQVGMIKEELGFDLEFNVPNPVAVAAVARSTSFAGFKLDDWFGTLNRSVQRRVMQEVNRGIVEGETVPQIMRRIRGTRDARFRDGVWNSTRAQAEAITRSTINHVTNQARIELFKENEDLIKGLKWTATLDSRTSLVCAGLDGRVFALDKGPRPPAHVNCRSTMTPVLKSARSLGLKDLPPGTRASINGEVPASVTFPEWLKKQPVSVQDDVLGKSRGALFRKGNLSIDKFTSDSLRPLTLEELKVKEKSAFQRSGLDV